MPIKKSALLLMAATAGSVSLLVFSSALSVPVQAAPITPVKCVHANCCSEVEENKTLAPLDMISQIMLRTEA